MTAALKSSTPLSAAAFGERLARLDPGRRVAVAFSGGPDSLALLILAAQWAKKSKHRHVVALTVDHGLRAEAAAEARLCARMAKSLGVTHRTLCWKGPKPASGLQAAARGARYALLAAACRADAIESLLVAHHMEDQAETFLLRLARGSGVDGLAGMAPVRLIEGAGDELPVRLLRPLLDVPRAALRAVVVQAGMQAVEDPSNDNLRFDRVKARQLLAELSVLGLSPQRLADTAAHLGRARQALDMASAGWLHAHAVLHPTGYIEAQVPALFDVPEEIALRALADMLKCIGARDYPPRFEALSGLWAAMLDGSLVRARTLNGCKVQLRDDQLLVMREASAAMKAAPVNLTLARPALWDGRFVVRLKRRAKGAGPLVVRALGAEGLRALAGLEVQAPAGPKAVLPALPALWMDSQLVAAPYFGTIDPDYVLEAEIRRNRLFAGS